MHISVLTSHTSELETVAPLVVSLGRCIANYAGQISGNGDEEIHYIPEGILSYSPNEKYLCFRWNPPKLCG